MNIETHPPYKPGQPLPEYLDRFKDPNLVKRWSTLRSQYAAYVQMVGVSVVWEFSSRACVLTWMAYRSVRWRILIHIFSRVLGETRPWVRRRSLLIDFCWQRLRHRRKQPRLHELHLSLWSITNQHLMTLKEENLTWRIFQLVLQITLRSVFPVSWKGSNWTKYVAGLGGILRGRVLCLHLSGMMFRHDVKELQGKGTNLGLSWKDQAGWTNLWLELSVR